MKRSGVIASIVAGILILGGVAACSDSPDGRSDKPTAQPGVVERVEAALPPEFPAEFPLTDGKVVQVDAFGTSGWSVTVLSESEKERNLALRKLEDQGYIVHGENKEKSGDQSYSLNNGKTSVSLVLTTSGSEFLAKYSFTPVA